MQKTNYYKQTISGFPLDAVYVGHFYDGVIQRKLRRFKFVHNTVDIVYFESIFRELLAESGMKNNPDIVIVYPPISLKDRVLRGPNHAKKLAKIFGKIIGSKNILCPFRKNFLAGHQSHRNKTQRKQIQSEYSFKETPNFFENKEIIFIDDIITTGYTAHTLGMFLRRMGASKITGFFLASHKI